MKPPYNVSTIAQEAVCNALKRFDLVEKTIEQTILEREKLGLAVEKLNFVKKIYPSDANFILVKTRDANSIYQYLLENEIVVRNRNNVELCAGCLRITVGTPEENSKLLKALKKYEKSFIH